MKTFTNGKCSLETSIVVFFYLPLEPVPLSVKKEDFPLSERPPKLE